MKKRDVKQHKAVWVVFTFLLAITWWLRFCSLNQHYRNICNERREIYKLGDIVPTGDNYLNKESFNDGYSIRVDAYDVADFDVYVRDGVVSPDVNSIKPEKLALVSITLINEYNTSGSFFLPDIWLHSIDNYAGMDWDLLIELNPILDSNYDIKLSPGESCEIILPFDFFRIYFAKDTWENIENTEFFLHITAYPIEKDICVIERTH